MAIGERIKAVRITTGLSQDDLIGNFFEVYRKAPEYQFKNNK